MSIQRACQHFGVSRQGLYQRRRRQVQQAARAEQVLIEVRAVRTKLPRLGTRKLRYKIGPRLRAQGVACGRDALFTLLRSRQLLVAKKRSFTSTCIAACRQRAVCRRWRKPYAKQGWLRPTAFITPTAAASTAPTPIKRPCKRPACAAR